MSGRLDELVCTFVTESSISRVISLAAPALRCARFCTSAATTAKPRRGLRPHQVSVGRVPPPRVASATAAPTAEPAASGVDGDQSDPAALRVEAHETGLVADSVATTTSARVTAAANGEEPGAIG